MPSLDWQPQSIFCPHFNITSKSIIDNRSIFKCGIVYHVNYGGRGGGKTYTYADAVVVESALRRVRILITREFQISIEESIKEEIEEAIITRGLSHFFAITKTSIIGMNGSKIIFKGIKNNINNLKSISNMDIVLCEEAENIKKDSWTKLLPSIRPKSGKDPIFIIIFNPDAELDETYQRWVINPPSQSLVTQVNWNDNKYFPEHLEKQRLHALKTQPKRDYDNTWEGKAKGSSGDVIIDLDWIKAARYASNNDDFIKVGDRVFSYDPAGQGKDSNAAVFKDGNRVISVDEWVKSKDLRIASERAIDSAISNNADRFIYDSCGGFGDGVEVFIKDRKKEKRSEIKLIPFDAGSPVVDAKKTANGSAKTWGELYANAKAQAHAITAQRFYNTYRFIELGERGIDPIEMISIDISDNELFNKMAKELSSPIWVKSETNSKKKVEDKQKMKKRTGQPSPNIADGIVMCNALTKVFKFMIG